MKREIISASEIERYAYCPLSWWLSRSGVDGKGFEIIEGGLKHEKLEDDLQKIKEEVKESKKSEQGITEFAIVTIILAIFGIIILFGRIIEELMGTILIIFALVWLLASSYFLYRLLKALDIIAKLRKTHGIPDGSIEYTERDSEQPLYSEKYALVGKPDYIIKKEGTKIPVEVKTGRVPRGPLFSHIMQIGAYSLLIEENYKEKPSYGIIEYEDHSQHKIDYTPDLKELVISKLDDMRKIFETKDVHRNHKRVGKCRGCSRKDACPEKLS